MIIGIDLGTNNVCLSYFFNNELRIISDSQGNSFIKSLIAINDSLIVSGNDVLNINDKEWVIIRNLKRLIGMSEEKISVHNKDYTIVELTSFLLSKVKKIIEMHLTQNNFPLEYQIVLTVPAYFNEKQRQSTKDAFSLCGMKLLRIINEPTSACITYYHYHKNFDKNVLVVDIGAGTTDISILTASKDEDNMDIYEVIATSGDNLLGGEDINNLLFEYYNKTHEKTEDNIKNIEKIKHELSDQIASTDLTIEKYEKLLEPLRDRLLQPIEKVIKIAQLNKEDINNVILIGGTSKVPYFKKLVESYFNQSFEYIINPLTAVSFGAALYGFKLTNHQLILMDIVPLSLGIETVGSQFIPIIERGTNIPVSKTKQFTTETDNQTEVIIKIFQGESQFIHENYLIGEFVLKDIPKQPRNVPVINVNISIDLNGLINITATDRKNFATSNLVIENKSKLSDEELDKIIENKKANDKLYDDYVNLIDNFYLFRNYYEKINYNTNINCVNKMTEEEKLEITNEINDINQYICSIVNKFEYKLKLDINKYCDNFIDIKENDIKRLVELIKLKNDELKTKYDILIITYANDENLLNNAVDKNADITNIEDEFKSIPIVVERDYETEFYNLIDQIHVNMEEFELKDTLKIELIEYISELISNDEIFKTKIDILNAYVDKLVETSK
jgi:molecular chaperone DnaK (HSP70)